MKKEISIATCVKCNSDAFVTFNFKHKEGKARNLKSMTIRTRTFLIPTCKKCRHDFKTGRFILKMMWGFTYIGFLLLIFGIIPPLFYPTFDGYVYLIIVGIIILILGKLIKLLISKQGYNPNVYIKYENGLFVKPNYAQTWIPYYLWSDLAKQANINRSTERERNYSEMIKEKKKNMNISQS